MIARLRFRSELKLALNMLDTPEAKAVIRAEYNARIAKKLVKDGILIEQAALISHLDATITRYRRAESHSPEVMRSIAVGNDSPGSGNRNLDSGAMDSYLTSMADLRQEGEAAIRELNELKTRFEIWKNT